MPSLYKDDIPSLRLTDITKAYGPVRVLDRAQISVRRGEVVALMGANGAGKSTLAKIAAGVASKRLPIWTRSCRGSAIAIKRPRLG